MKKMVKIKKGFFSAGVIFAFAAMSLAQVTTEPASASSPGPAAASTAQNPAAAADALRSGTILSVELSKSLDARKSKANDRIEAKTATDLLAHGQIVVPRNTKIIGHVTEAKARSKTSPGSMVGFTFDRLLLKDGREMPLQAAVQAIARPLQFGSAPEGNMPPSARQPGMPQMPGQRGQVGDAPISGASSPYPGDLSAPPDPIASSSSTVVPLSPTSKGVVGMKGLSLDTAGPVSVLSSNTGNVRLDTGTQLILRVR